MQGPPQSAAACDGQCKRLRTLDPQRSGTQLPLRGRHTYLPFLINGVRRVVAAVQVLPPLCGAVEVAQGGLRPRACAQCVLLCSARRCKFTDRLACWVALLLLHPLCSSRVGTQWLMVSTQHWMKRACTPLSCRSGTWDRKPAKGKKPASCGDNPTRTNPRLSYLAIYRVHDPMRADPPKQPRQEVASEPQRRDLPALTAFRCQAAIDTPSRNPTPPRKRQITQRTSRRGQLSPTLHAASQHVSGGPYLQAVYQQNRNCDA